MLTRIEQQPRDASRSGNCKAGFVADRGLSSALARDFYLLSHGGLLGSKFPTSKDVEEFISERLLLCLVQRAGRVITWY